MGHPARTQVGTIAEPAVMAAATAAELMHPGRQIQRLRPRRWGSGISHDGAALAVGLLPLSCPLHSRVGHLPPHLAHRTNRDQPNSATVKPSVPPQLRWPIRIQAPTLRETTSRRAHRGATAIRRPACGSWRSDCGAIPLWRIWALCSGRKPKAGIPQLNKHRPSPSPKDSCTTSRHTSPTVCSPCMNKAPGHSAAMPTDVLPHLLVLLTLAAPWSVAAQPRQATVLSIGDGDTLRVRQGGRAITVRLACIDAPEMAQRPHGLQARDYLQQRLPIGQQVRLDVKTTDRYGRTRGEGCRRDQHRSGHGGGRPGLRLPSVPERL